jgi:hypothetical protein
MPPGEVPGNTGDGSAVLLVVGDIVIPSAGATDGGSHDDSVNDPLDAGFQGKIQKCLSTPTTVGHSHLPFLNPAYRLSLHNPGAPDA